MPTHFIISKNSFLKEDAEGYFNCYYRGYRQPDNPDFINILKNNFNDESYRRLKSAKEEVVSRLIEDLPQIINYYGLRNCVIVVIPRAKAYDTYTDEQMFFKRAVSEAADKMLGVVNGTDYIRRHTNTRTTHLRKETGRVSKQGSVTGNDGELPYPGITNETCHINKVNITGRDLILVEDIYTKTTNIDEDCIQALRDAGARNVIFYAIAYTRRNS